MTAAGARLAWTRMPGNLRGMALMAAAAVIFSVEVLFIRWMNDRGIPVATQLLVRALGQFVWIAPLLLGGGVAVFRTARLPMHLFRGACSLATWGLYFLSFRYLDPATGTVLSFTNVMFTTMLAAPLLGEAVGRARWAGTLIGLFGVAVMLRPGAGIDPLGAAIAIGAAICWCGITLTSRMLTRTERTQTVFAWVGLVTSLGAAPFAIATWMPLGLGDVAVLAVFGCVTPAILWLITEALRAGEASAVAPLQYLRLPIVALAGWLIWGQVPDAAAWAGAAVILAGAVIVTVAEARAASQAANRQAASAASSGAGSKPKSP
ncbi:threonine/homoserine efflux transporter RhtA [Humitalea rosea]|uniref:Threonine/homoserine efflux transporter RhtA n=1 Tax=Humitalea rosea TaxID=990373 RepID=A0A2W7IH50_9PROT|nr:DMT family transporter [Humitalea rosea]PZW45939.1 threonine/homoserine efflux transporter RhtA [Humitalea rosea]